MKTIVLNCSGTPYERGLISGQFFKKVLNDNWLNQMNRIDQNLELRNKCEEMMNKLKEEAFDYYEEVRGKADGLGLDLLHFFSLMTPELSNIQFEHCTTILCKKDNGHFILSHNEDDNYVEDNFCLAKVQNEDGHWFMTNDMLNMPFGNGISWNSHGIIKSINYTHEENIMTNYLPRYFGQRHISEATSLDDLIKRCTDFKWASGFHINAIDLNSMQAASIEVYNETISVKKIEDYSVHTNHYVHNDHIKDPKTDKGSNSVFRFYQAHELMKDSPRTKEAIKQILDYRSEENRFDNSIFQTKEDPYLTLFNMTFDTESNDEVHLSVYVTDETLTFTYHQ